jgi:hypothetical protein
LQYNIVFVSWKKSNQRLIYPIKAIEITSVFSIQNIEHFSDQFFNVVIVAEEQPTACQIVHYQCAQNITVGSRGCYQPKVYSS